MCLSLLNQLNSQRLPADLTAVDEIDRGLLLREAGLVAALRLQRPDTPSPGMVLRVLAITERGRRVLRTRQREPVENTP